MTENPTNRELDWRNYSLGVEMYRFYLDLIIKVAIFHYAITGGILSFILTNLEIEEARYGLGVPILMSISLCGLFFWGQQYAVELQEDSDSLASKLNLDAGFELSPLVFGIQFFKYLYAVTSIVLLGALYIV